MKKQILFKYDQDDILEIITEYMAEKHGFGESYARAMLFGIPDKDLRAFAFCRFTSHVVKIGVKYNWNTLDAI